MNLFASQSRSSCAQINRPARHGIVRALVALFVTLAGTLPIAHGQRLAVYQDNSELTSGSYAYLLPSTQSGNVYEPSMPKLSVAYVEKSGGCGVITWSLNVTYQGYHFANYDYTLAPPLNNTLYCGSKYLIPWNQMDDFYGGNMTIDWSYQGYDGQTSSGTVLIYIAGANPSNSTVDSALATVLPSNFPLSYYEQIIAEESAAHGKKIPSNQYHQYYGYSGGPVGSGYGSPLDTCACPEGIGLGQIDNHNGSAPAYVPPRIFWNWYANLQESSSRLKTGINSGTNNYNASVSAAVAAGGSSVPPAQYTGSCSFSSSTDFINANGMTAYNGGGKKSYIAWQTNPATGVVGWTLSKPAYVQKVCGTAAL